MYSYRTIKSEFQLGTEGTYLMSLFHTESPGVKEIQVQAGQDWNPDVESAGVKTNSKHFYFVLYNFARSLPKVTNRL